MINLAICEIWICIWKYYHRSRKLDVQTWCSSRKCTALLVWIAMFLFESYKSPCFQFMPSWRERNQKTKSFLETMHYYILKLREHYLKVFKMFFLAYFYHLLFELIPGNFDQGRLRAQVFMDDYRHGSPNTPPRCCRHWWAGLTAWRDEKMRRRKFTIIKQISHSPYIRSCVYHSIYVCLLLIVLLGMVMSQSWWLSKNNNHSF